MGSLSFSLKGLDSDFVAGGAEGARNPAEMMKYQTHQNIHLRSDFFRSTGFPDRKLAKNYVTLESAYLADTFSIWNDVRDGKYGYR